MFDSAYSLENHNIRTNGGSSPHNGAMRIRAAFLIGVAAALFAGCTTSQSGAPVYARHFDIGLIGDAPYTEEQITTSFPNLLAALDRERLAFVVHDGDIKAGDMPCSDAVFEDRLRDFQSSSHPLVYIFGDNEWTDCSSTNGFSPEERLQKLRDLFTRGEESLGRRKLRLTRQSNGLRFSEFRENVRWSMRGVMFVGLNVPGAINDYGKPEFAERNAANIAWIKESFEVAKLGRRSALMFIMQANPFPERGATNRMHAGFKEMMALLEQQTIAFKKPVVLVHGDSHYFRIDKPLVDARGRRIENFTRVETFGNPDVHWVRVTVDPRTSDVFTFRPEIVAENAVQHETLPTNLAP